LNHAKEKRSCAILRQAQDDIDSKNQSDVLPPLGG
jgi:hypothetical protein